MPFVVLHAVALHETISASYVHVRSVDAGFTLTHVFVHIQRSIFCLISQLITTLYVPIKRACNIIKTSTGNFPQCYTTCLILHFPATPPFENQTHTDMLPPLAQIL